MFGSVDIGSSWGSSIGSSWGSSIGSSWGGSIGSSFDDGCSLGDTGDASVGHMVGVSHNSGGNRLLDDGLSLDRDGVGGIVRGINMDRVGNLDNVVPEDRGIIGDGDLALNKDGSLNVVDLDLGVDDGSIDGLCSLEDGGDLDGEEGGGGLDDPGVVARHIAGLSVVDLLGDDGGGLVDGGGACALGQGGVGGGGSGLGVGLVDGLDRAVRDEAVSLGRGASAVGHGSVA